MHDLSYMSTESTTVLSGRGNDAPGLPSPGGDGPATARLLAFPERNADVRSMIGDGAPRVRTDPHSAADVGIALFQMSYAVFQDPSGCRSQITT